MGKQMFAKAIELDPLYARAYAGAADCDSFLYLDYSEGSSLRRHLRQLCEGARSMRWRAVFPAGFHVRLWPISAQSVCVGLSAAGES